MPVSTTLDHVTIVTDDFEASRPVYDAVLAALGMTVSVDYIDPEGDDEDTGTVAAIGYGLPGMAPLLWLVAGLSRTSGAHLAVAVTDRSAVLAAHQAALAAGARVVQPPRDWEQARLGYFGAQFADPAGNLIEVLFRAVPDSAG
ncbi:MAG: VOC family protein [Actinomycetota bacterium]|nr:VOC family protein [Actinomycetota bacterium]MDQ2955576.1 VOC family protein [Actinomycetota bacterium]